MRIAMSMLALLLTAGTQAQTVENDFGLNDQPGNAQPFEPLKVIYSRRTDPANPYRRSRTADCVRWCV